MGEGSESYKWFRRAGAWGVERATCHLLMACLDSGRAAGTECLCAGAPGSENPDEEPPCQLAFWATFTSSELHARRRLQGVALTFQLLQAACHLGVLFLRSM